jgi:hypothetical protein
VAEHRPETAQRLGRNARAEHRHVAFQIGADEVAAPAQAGTVARGKEAVGEAATGPESFEVGRRRFQRIDGMQFEIGDAARERLAGLLEELDRR